MRFFAALSLAGLAAANPVKDLEARQLNPSQSSTCSASYTRSCASGTSMSAARTWCSSLGYGTTWSTVRRTATINRTVMMTMTSTTSTSTITAARVTNTATSVRTTMTTQTTTTTSSTTFTETQVINTFGVIDACPNYTPANTNPNPEVPGVDSTTTSATTTTAAASSSCALVRPAGPSGDCGGVLGYRSREQDGNGVTLSQGTLTDPASIASLEGCALACRKFDDSRALGASSGLPGCISVYWTPNRSCELYRGNLGDTRWMPGTGANARYQAASMSCFTCSDGSVQAQSTTTTMTVTTTTPALPTTTTRTTTTPAITTTSTTTRGMGCPNPTPTSFTRAGVVRFYEMCVGFMDPSGSNIRPVNEAGCEAACIGKCVAFNYYGDDNNCRTMASVSEFRTIGSSWKAYSLVSKSTISPAATTTSASTNTVPTTCALSTANARNPAWCNTRGQIWTANDGTGPLKQKYIENVPSIEACAAECRKLDASGAIGESGLPGCQSFWWGYDRSCELQRKDLAASGFQVNGFGYGANMDCFSCAAVGASSSSTTTTARTTTSSLTTTTTTTQATTTTTASTTTAAAGSCALTAPNPPNPSVCHEQYTGWSYAYRDSNNVPYQQRRLTDSASRASAEACAKACKAFDQGGFNGDSGAPGCKAFSWDSSSCTLYRGEVSELGLSRGAGPRFLDLSCFQCRDVPTPVSPPPAQVTNGQYTGGCPGSGDYNTLEYEGGATFQMFCGPLASPLPISRFASDSFESCVGSCVYVSNCTAATYATSGPDAGQCQLSTPDGSLQGVAYRKVSSDPNFAAGSWSGLISAGRVKRYSNDIYPNAVAFLKRDIGLSPRQGQYPQPACLKATNAIQTTAACNCVIPSSSVTLTQTVSSVVTNARTISTTLNLVATTTMTPTTTVTTTRVTTLFRTKAITAWKTFSTTATVESTTSYSLQATPSAFYIVDQDMAFAEWPADADEIHYHIQYDWDQSDDEYAPTVFSLDNDKLQVADLSNMDGLAEGYPVVGQSDGTGMQLMALSDGGGLESPTCSIEPTKEGQCPIICRMGEMEVNTRNGDGLWTLVPKGGEEGFTNYALAADVAVEDEGGDGGEPAMGAFR